MVISNNHIRIYSLRPLPMQVKPRLLFQLSKKLKKQSSKHLCLEWEQTQETMMNTHAHSLYQYQQGSGESTIMYNLARSHSKAQLRLLI
ncbi:hypothetical protein HanPSC8_Chr10g0439861 [Helianthus annuus]|nr:hypothetical protein HanPSC8_Chr10g0439861 [Helianthus annuus]